MKKTMAEEIFFAVLREVTDGFLQKETMFKADQQSSRSRLTLLVRFTQLAPH